MGNIDVATVFFFLVVIFLGIWFKIPIISVIFAAILVIYFVTAAREPPAPQRSAVPQGPRVRPIVVKRRYVGPDSIYPAKMKIRVTEKGVWTDNPWWEVAGKAVGETLNGFERWAKKGFK